MTSESVEKELTVSSEMMAKLKSENELMSETHQLMANRTLCTLRIQYALLRIAEAIEKEAGK